MLSEIFFFFLQNKGILFHVAAYAQRTLITFGTQRWSSFKIGYLINTLGSGYIIHGGTMQKLALKVKWRYFWKNLPSPAAEFHTGQHWAALASAAQCCPLIHFLWVILLPNSVFYKIGFGTKNWVQKLTIKPKRPYIRRQYNRKPVYLHYNYLS